jgi:hypothetical protein
LMADGTHYTEYLFSYAGEPPYHFFKEDKFYVSLPLPQTPEQQKAFAAAINNLSKPLTSIIGNDGESIPLPPPAQKQKKAKPSTVIDEIDEHTPPKKRKKSNEREP